MIKQFERLQLELDKQYKDKKSLYKKSNKVLEELVKLGIRTEPMVNPVTKEPYHAFGFVSERPDKITMEWTMWNWQVMDKGHRTCGNGYGKFSVTIPINGGKVSFYAQNRKTDEMIKEDADKVPNNIAKFIKKYKEELEIG